MSELPSIQDEDSTLTPTSNVPYFHQLYGSNHSSNASQGTDMSTATQNYNIGLATLGESNNTHCAYEAAIKYLDAHANSSENVTPVAQIASKMIENDI